MEHTHRLPYTWGVLPSSIPSSCVPVAVLPFEPLEQGLIATYCLPSDKPIHALLISHLWKCRAVRGGGLREKILLVENTNIISNLCISDCPCTARVSLFSIGIFV